MLGATVYTFSLILAVVLVGLGLGSSAGAYLARVVRHPRTALGWCQLLLPIGIAMDGIHDRAVIAVLAGESVAVDAIRGCRFQFDMMRCAWADPPGDVALGCQLSAGDCSGRDRREQMPADWWAGSTPPTRWAASSARSDSA